MIGENYTVTRLRARQPKFVCITTIYSTNRRSYKGSTRLLRVFFTARCNNLIGSKNYVEIQLYIPRRVHANATATAQSEQQQYFHAHDREKFLSSIPSCGSLCWVRVVGLDHFKAAVLAVAKYLTYLFGSDDNDAEYHILRIWRGIMKKPSVPVPV